MVFFEDDARCLWVYVGLFVQSPRQLCALGILSRKTRAALNAASVANGDLARSWYHRYNIVMASSGMTTSESFSVPEGIRRLKPGELPEMTEQEQMSDWRVHFRAATLRDRRCRLLLRLGLSDNSKRKDSLLSTDEEKDAKEHRRTTTTSVAGAHHIDPSAAPTLINMGRGHGVEACDGDGSTTSSRSGEAPPSSVRTERLFFKEPHSRKAARRATAKQKPSPSTTIAATISEDDQTTMTSTTQGRRPAKTHHTHSVRPQALAKEVLDLERRLRQLDVAPCNTTSSTSSMEDAVLTSFRAGGGLIEDTEHDTFSVTKSDRRSRTSLASTAVVQQRSMPLLGHTKGNTKSNRKHIKQVQEKELLATCELLRAQLLMVSAERGEGATGGSSDPGDNHLAATRKGRRGKKQQT